MSDIIKCKGCAFYRKESLLNKSVSYCAHNHGMNLPDPEDYCSHAEKKLPPKLKSCPFCGGNGVFILHSLNDNKYHIICPECDVNIGKFETEEEAVENWNRRAERHIEKIDLGIDWEIQLIPQIEYEDVFTESLSGVPMQTQLFKGYSYPVKLRFFNKKDHNWSYSIDLDRSDLIDLLHKLFAVKKQIKNLED